MEDTATYNPTLSSRPSKRQEDVAQAIKKVDNVIKKTKRPVKNP
jgi:hypothetical protein